MKNISGFLEESFTNDNEFIKYAYDEISNYKKFNKYMLLKQIITFLLLKILNLKFSIKFLLKFYTKHIKNNTSVLKIVYPSLKFKSRFSKQLFYKNI